MSRSGRQDFGLARPLTMLDQQAMRQQEQYAGRSRSTCNSTVMRETTATNGHAQTA